MRFFSKENVVGQILQDLGHYHKSTAQGWRVFPFRDLNVDYFRGDYCRRNKSKSIDER